MAQNPKDVLNSAAQRMYDEFRKFAPVKASLEGNTRNEKRNRLAVLLDREENLRPALDAACAYWIVQTRWPDMDDLAAMLLTHRFEQALSLVAFLQTRSGQFVEKTEEEILEILLIEYWQLFGRTTMKGQLYELD